MLYKREEVHSTSCVRCSIELTVVALLAVARSILVQALRFLGEILALSFSESRSGVMMEMASRRLGRIELDGNSPSTEENIELPSVAVTRGDQTADRGGSLNTLPKAPLILSYQGIAVIELTLIESHHTKCRRLQCRRNR
jgi:hypothetical protein